MPTHGPVALTLTDACTITPLSGQPDQPENYHALTYALDAHDGSTHVADDLRPETGQNHSYQLLVLLLAQHERVVNRAAHRHRHAIMFQPPRRRET
jgi:hypothetical protein